MEATDKTFTWGQIGLGSFDDTADFAELKVIGVPAKKTRKIGRWRNQYMHVWVQLLARHFAAHIREDNE